MSRTVSPASGRPYGLARVCRVWRASRATIYRHLSSSRPEPPRRPGPVGSMPDPALLEAIRAVLGASPGVDRRFVERLFADNPLGQAREQTPVCVIREIAWPADRELPPEPRRRLTPP